MGCCAIKDVSSDDKQTEELDKMLEEEKIRAALDFKILLLGAGESGKSTCIKQLRNIYLGKAAMSMDEIKSYTSVLHTNTIQSIKALIFACKTLDISIEPIKETADKLSELDEQERLTSEQATQIDELWKSETLQEAYSRKSEIYFPDAGPYYFENAARFAEDSFLPTEEDIVMARIRTTGMLMTAFEVPPIHLRIVDVGGQRSERKKWIRFFDDVEAILFIVNLAGFNQVLFEDQKKNRMIEALELFEQIATNECFSKTPIFLFLNKKDLFEELLRKHDISVCFPEFDGEKTTQAQLDYIASEFEKRMPPGKKFAGVNFIAARLKRDVKYAFEDATDFLISHNQTKIDKAVKTKNKMLSNNT